MVDARRPEPTPYLDTLKAPATEADRQDVTPIRGFESEADQAAVARARATMASSARR